MSSKEFVEFLTKLAKRITEKGHLRLLGNTLGVRSHEIEAAIKDNSNNFTEAVEDVLNIWKGGIKHGDQTKMIEELREAFTHINRPFDFNEVELEVYGAAQSHGKRQDLPMKDDVDAPRHPAQSPHDGQPLSEEASAAFRTLLEKELKEPPRELGNYERNTRGLAIIINNWHWGTPDEDLPGYKEDVKTIEKVLDILGLDLSPLDPNMTSEKLEEELQKLTAKVGSYSCICVFVLSHGNETSLKTSNGWMEVRKLTECFCKIEALKGKPKLFFIQTCRGEEHGRARGAGMLDKGTHPLDADVFELYACPLGYKSYVYDNVGSNFIQCLCYVLQRHYNKEILEIGTLTNEKISTLITKCRGYSDDCAQVSMINSTLTRKFYFPYNA